MQLGSDIKQAIESLALDKGVAVESTALVKKGVATSLNVMTLGLLAEEAKKPSDAAMLDLKNITKEYLAV